ncbi:E3 SUMO-protein ligase NSE2 [Neodiprion pinetum]|uniref:E3 SUMO-protein ligase NSE2 n=1 Tax=Neodiprion lecontei TaxID=441921 RepID=A0A6J0BA25_NEOLC|nr:E3 SUMO-protein ligase NSE2 [Neodiprion lecontei]XP_046415328.1 E3 SUMO-protein ligase NSE2-like [Neodiprion fabricii]XP_046471788.1 E3 SUMO-protein ligase NSE2-like [Neodiprion pinetum]XP_046608992.1 E3 SUMO-protein ligase NSE2-like [Neodiprion virginianus]
MSSLQEAPKEIYNLYLQTALNIVTYFEDESQEERLKELTDLAEVSAKLDLKLKKSCEILQRLSAPQDDFNGNQEVIDHAQTLEQFTNEIEGIDTDVNKHKKFQDFQQQVQVLLENTRLNNAANVNDDELVLTQNDINVIDPITKRRINDPVRNTVCGHVYDRGSVEALLKANKQTRCPVAGCANKNYLQLDNFQTDILTKRYLDRNPHAD